MGSILAYRRLKRKAERVEREGLEPETGLPAGRRTDPVQTKVRRIQHVYELIVAVLLWALLAALLRIGGGWLIRRAAERRLRGLG